jgi:DNA-binding transcriptional MerR regulator
MTREIDLKKLGSLMTKIYAAFGSSGEIPKLMNEVYAATIQPEIAEHKAYRVIMLSPGLENEGGIDEWKKAQLDWDRVKDPLSSWSKNLTGVHYYSSKHSIEKYEIILEATILGFSLSDYTNQIIKAGESILKDATPEEKKLIINELISGLKRTTNFFEKEEELVALKVLDYKIISKKHVPDEI